MDAIKASLKITIEELPILLRRYLEQSRSTIYRSNFPWVDHIAEVKGTSLLDALNERLLERIRLEEFDRCWMAVPDIIEWAEVDGFRYGLKARNAKYNDLHLSEFIEEVKETRGTDFSTSNIDLKLLKQRDVLCIGDDDHTIRRWSLYSCLYCELDHQGHTYLLSGGKWYRLGRDFVTEVNKYFEQLPRFDTELPEYNDNSEETYNARICDENAAFALMDQKLIKYGGPRSGVEFCDIFTTGRDIIHVKRYGQSKVFSHFFSQGTVSAELFHTQSEFRHTVNDTLPDTHKIADPRKVPDRDEYRIVFGIVSDAAGSTLSIPFFSRLNLRAASNRLIGYGYRVALSKISVSEMRRKTKRY